MRTARRLAGDPGLCLRAGVTVDEAAAPDPVGYLDAVAALPVGLQYKDRLVRQLGLRPGGAALDIGCGPGTDLGRLAEAVGETGSVVGVDSDPLMLAKAAARTADRATVELRQGDAQELPLADGSVDAAKVDRVLQHVDDPARVLAEAEVGPWLQRLAEGPFLVTFTFYLITLQARG